MPFKLYSVRQAFPVSDNARPTTADIPTIHAAFALFPHHPEMFGEGCQN